LSLERKRPRRYPLLAPAELTHVLSGAHMKQVISDISAFGCHVSTRLMWPVGSRVKIQINHDNKIFCASARVIYGSPMQGMGIAFMDVDQENRALLDLWIAGRRRTMRGQTAD